MHNILALPAPTTAVGRDTVEDLRQFARLVRRSWPLLAISVVVCLTFASIYLAQARRMYQASTQVLVIQQGGRPLNVGSNDPGRVLEGADDLISTHAMIVSSSLVVGRAIESVGRDNLPSLGDVDNPVKQAVKRLRVSRPDRTAKILQIDYRAWSREEAVRMVEAIVASYQKFLEDSYQKNNSEVISLITKARDELSTEVEDLEKKYLEFRQNTSVVTADESGRTFVARRLDYWDRAINEASVKKIQLRTQLNLGKTLTSDGIGIWAVSYALSQLGGDSSSLAAAAAGSGAGGPSDFIRQLYQEQQQLAERFGPQYSKVQQIHEQITRIQERSRESRSRLDKAELDELIRSIEQGLKSVETMRGELVQQFDQDVEEARKVEIDRLTESNIRGNLDRHRSMFSTIVQQLKQAQFVSNFSSVSAQTIEPANAQQSPVEPRMILTLALALFIGFVAGTGGAVAIDKFDQHIHSPEDLRRALGYPLLGLIPQIQRDQVATVGDPGLVGHALPRSVWAESYRSIRTSLEFLRRSQRIQTMLVTSPHPGDGKSTTASNLAISVAQTGRKVLLVDADLRKPWQHKIYGQGREFGLSQILRSVLPIARAITETTVPNLDLMTTGPDVANPAELLASPAFGAFLEEARRLYDIIIVDSSPLLAVTDAAIIGAMVDGVVLVARPATLSHQEAERIQELLGNLGAPILGMVVNGIRLGNRGQAYGIYVTYGEPATASEMPVPSMPQPSTNGHSHTADSGERNL